MANLIVRIPDALHKVSRVAAATREISLNAWICQAILGAAMHAGRAKPGGPVAAALTGLATDPQSAPRRKIRR